MTKYLSYDQAHEYVENTNNAYWNNYSIIIFTPDKSAQSSKRGVFNRRLSKWGYERSYPVNSNGKWKIS